MNKISPAMSKENTKEAPQAKQTDPANSSSTLKALAQMNKEAEKKESAQEAMRVRCKTCFKEVSPKRLCAGHGGGLGGSNSTNDASHDDEQDSDDSMQFDSTLEQLTDTLDESLDTTMSLKPSMKPTSDSFDPKIIEELIAKGLLSIISDRDTLTLSIQLQCDPHRLSNTQRLELNKYISSILKELDTFKREHDISAQCVTMNQNKQGLSLQITLPTLALYDQFIKQLANKLIPTPSPKLQDTTEHKETATKAPTPFDLEPKPQPFNPSPFPMELNRDV